MSIRVLVVHRQDLACEGVRSLLSQQAGMSVVGEAATGEQSRDLIIKTKPNVVLLDCVMPEANGIDITRSIVANAPGSHVLGMLNSSDPDLVHAMLEAGAMGVLIKADAHAELPQAVRKLAKGEMYVSSDILTLVTDFFIKHRAKEQEQASGLTPAEKKVLGLLAEDISTKAVADRLFVCTATVKKHIQNIRRKLNVQTRAGLVRYAIHHGIANSP